MDLSTVMVSIRSAIALRAIRLLTVDDSDSERSQSFDRSFQRCRSFKTLIEQYVDQNKARRHLAGFVTHLGVFVVCQLKLSLAFVAKVVQQRYSRYSIWVKEQTVRESIVWTINCIALRLTVIYRSTRYSYSPATSYVRNNGDGETRQQTSTLTYHLLTYHALHPVLSATVSSTQHCEGYP